MLLDNDKAFLWSWHSTLKTRFPEQDYKPTNYLIKHVYLNFLLNEDTTRVISRLSIVPNYGTAGSPPRLELDGTGLPTSIWSFSQQCHFSCPEVIFGCVQCVYR